MLVFLVVLFRASNVKLFTLHFPMCSISIGATLMFFFSLGAATCAAQSTASPPADAATRANALYQQGLSVLKKGDLASARTAFEKVVRLAPQSPESHNSLGWVLLAQGEVDAAIAHFQTAVKLNPEFAQAHMNLASALAGKKDLHGALRESQEATRLAPNDSETHHTLGRILDFSGEVAGAISELRRAIELEPQKHRTLKAPLRNFPKRSGCSPIMR
ncbi:MAG: hypothetical protein DMG55_31195 [Acidobacteria bacterium]|nr:MAG: hypothetical protein DMG55_31195 [Acidobacteriota bacterium]